MIYFARVESNGLIKIGCSTDIERRLYQLERLYDCPVSLIGSCQGSYTAERTIHKMFSAEAVGKELFTESEKLTQFIGDLNSFCAPDEEREVYAMVFFITDKEKKKVEKWSSEWGGISLKISKLIRKTINP